MKALSTCKGSMLAAVLAAGLSGLFHGSALADACPAQDFGKFLSAFSSDADTAQRYTVPTPSRSTLAPYSEPGSLAPRIARVNRSDLIPLLAGMPTQAGKGVEVRKVDGTRTRQFSGSGLGLSLARRLAGLVQGEITLTSAPGVGSTFTLDLPLRHDASAS